MESASTSTKSSSIGSPPSNIAGSTPQTSVESGSGDVFASSSRISASQNSTAPMMLRSIRVALSGIVPDPELMEVASWNKEKVLVLSKRLEALDTFLEVQRRGEEAQGLKLGNNLKRTIETTSTRLQKIRTTSRFDKLVNENSHKTVLSDHFEEMSSDISVYRISLLQTLLVTCLEIMEIAGIQTFDEQEKELKRRNNLKRSLARLASIPQNTYAVSLSRRRLTKEHKEGLVYCVWSMRGSLRAYQGDLQQHLLKIYPGIMTMEPQVGAEEKLKLHKLQTKFSVIATHYSVMLDQSPVAIFEKSRDNDTLLGYTERIRDILTDYQDCLNRLWPNVSAGTGENNSVERVVTSDHSGSSQTLNSFSTRWDVDFVKIHLSSSEGRKILRAADKDNALLVVDLIDEILDSSSINSTHSASYIRTMQSICGRCAILPTSHIISDGLEIISKEPVAHGGFADVFQGRLKSILVAVKVFNRTQLDHTDRLRRMFYKEAVLWRRLSHENVLPFLGAASLTLYPLALVSAWMQKGDIVGYIKTNRQVNRLELLVDVSAGVEYLHSLNLAHGDLKGRNILISAEDRALLADFGLMTVVHDSGATDIATVTTSSRGTVRWMSPELVDPETFGAQHGNPTKASDVYALAMVILEVLTGKVPFHTLGVIPVITKVIRGHYPIRPKNSMDIGLSDNVWEVVRLCWNTDASERPDVKRVLEVIKAESKCWNVAPRDISDEEKHVSDDSSIDHGPSPDASSIYSSAIRRGKSIPAERDVTLRLGLKSNQSASPPVSIFTDQMSGSPKSSYYSLDTSRSPSPEGKNEC